MLGDLGTGYATPQSLQYRGVNQLRWKRGLWDLRWGEIRQSTEQNWEGHLKAVFCETFHTDNHQKLAEPHTKQKSIQFCEILKSQVLWTNFSGAMMKSFKVNNVLVKCRNFCSFYFNGSTVENSKFGYDNRQSVQRIVCQFLSFKSIPLETGRPNMVVKRKTDKLIQDRGEAELRNTFWLVSLRPQILK